MKNILLIVGTRPEAIKMAPLVRALEAAPEDFNVVVCSTGQHREMLSQVLALFSIQPAYELDVMKPSQTLAGLTSRLVDGLTRVVAESDADVVLVHGDTTTALSGALAGYYNRIPVGHVEAGLRTRDRYQPFPEEMNRHLVDVLSTFHFAPTEQARLHLIEDGILEEGIHITGNTVIDALHTVIRMPSEVPVEIDTESRKLILVTAHRRESFGRPLENVCTALLNIVETFPDVEIVYPVHYNPNVRDTVYGRLSDRKRIHLLEPLPYLQFAQMMSRSYLILTDSGGIQEEAPSLGIPVLVMRDITERPEAVDAGTVRVIGTDSDSIEHHVRLLMNTDEHDRMARAINPYGDGKASSRIVDFLQEHLD